VHVSQHSINKLMFTFIRFILKQIGIIIYKHCFTTRIPFLMKEYLSGYVNILKTIIGSGILYIPMLFKSYGAISTFFLMCLSATLSMVGQIIFLYCNAFLNDRSTNITSLARESVPRTRFLVDFFVFFKCFGVSTSYLIIIRELIPNLIQTVFGESVLARPKVALLIFLCFISPITYFRQLKNLKYTSSIGLIAISFILFFSMYNFIKHGSLEHVTLYEPITIEWLKGLGTFVFAFTCHQNLISVQNEVVDNSPDRMKKIVYATTATSLVIYMVFGFTNYALYATNMHDNVLKSYPNDHITLFLHFLYVCVMGFSYPLQINPARVYMYNLLGFNTKKRNNNLVHAVITTLLLASTYVLTITGLNLGEMYAFVGATASTMICLIFPLLFYYNMGLERKRWLIIFGCIGFVFGSCVFALSLFKLLKHQN
ncbi:Amino Acid/Auxin Permease (AAAP) Family, partial [Trachipleistophora hominis]